MSQTQVAADSVRLGDRAESAVIESVDGLEYVPDSEGEHYDAEPVTAIGPSDELDFAGIAVLERGVPIEIKSCIPRLSSGQRGRFYLRRGQHDRLADDGGIYLFAVVSPHDREPITCKVAAALSVEDVIPSWRDAGAGRQQYSQISWPSIFDVSEVRR